MTNNLHPFNTYFNKLIFPVGGRMFLVSTGHRSSISRSMAIDFMGRSFKTNSAESGDNVSIERISEILDVEIDSIIGLDILRNFNIIIDFANSTLYISEAYDEFGKPLPFAEDFEMSTSMKWNSLGYIEIPVNIGDDQLDLILDTNARLSYINPEISSKHKPTGSDRVFHPKLGYFTTKTYNLNTAVGDKEFATTYGNLPLSIEVLLRMSNIKGVIGSDLIKSFKIGISIAQSKIFLN